MQIWDKDPKDPQATGAPMGPKGDIFLRYDARNNNSDKKGGPALPTLQLPKGGGAIRGIDEKFKVNAVNGTSSFSIPLPLSPSRAGYRPPLSLAYSSGDGNSPFGLGWSAEAPSIMRRTRNYLPKYEDDWESDIFQLSDTEDLQPLLVESGGTGSGSWTRSVLSRSVGGIDYSIALYRPRIESSFARIERWTVVSSGDTHWRVLSPDNSTSYYGLSNASRVCDPQDPSRVFQWLLCQSQDDKGNLVLLNYKTEDGVGIPPSLSEKNKPGMCTQVYLSSIWYGNIQPFYEGDTLPGEDQFLFRVLFDYGEHDPTQPVPGDIYKEIQPWACRKDPFSSFRSGFDIRTYRRCSRVLMFHCFPNQELPQNPCLVRSLDLFYDDDLSLLGNGDVVPGFSFLVKATQKGYIWDSVTLTYSSKSLPDMVFSYQQHAWNTQVQEVTAANRAGAPVGVDQKSYNWVDLFSEGIMGILTEQGNAWYYKSNLGAGAFSVAEQVALLPSYRGMSSEDISIRELEGNGEKYLVQEKTRPQSFFKLSPENQWCKGRLFEQFPTIDLNDRNARFVDLNEDGREEILYTEDLQFLWYEGIGECGFRLAGTTPKAFDEEKGPAIVFADKDQSIFLADMTGDGLVDIVRIRNGEVCYWPNLGYALYGAKVGMDNAPVFDSSDGFNPSYLRLADVDGSGTTDIVYLGREGFQVWMNLSGNAWSQAPEIIAPFPSTGNDTTIDVLDFLGTGTACIVCSSPYSAEPFRFIDLMGSKKPCLLTSYQNNCGKSVTLEYASSTSFYLADKAAGIPWFTKLPFPVQCIAKVATADLVRESVLTSSYSYRHGFYDPYDKEFRGFARTEQVDTESFEQFVLNKSGNVTEQDLYQPPVRTVSWFHTGAFLWSRDLVALLSQEYFKNTAFPEYAMPDPILPQGMDPNDLHEAYRACKGMLLRTEVYSDDGSSLQTLPYSAGQANAQVIMLQPKGPNRYASFLVVPSESISYGYERIPGDPRISHSFVMVTDLYGNVTRGATVCYPRVSRPTGAGAIPDAVWNQQDQLHAVTLESDYTIDVIQPDVYRLRVPCETRAYEIGGLTQPGGFYFTLATLSPELSGLPVIPYEQDFSGGLQQRLYRHGRVYYAANDLSGPLALGNLESLGIVYTSNYLAFTAGLVTQYYGVKVTTAMLTSAMYTHSEGDADWWTQPGLLLYSATTANDFYLPIASQDVFGNTSSIQFDSYFLLPVSATDALSNTMSATNDYRILSPVLITDPNLNRSAVQTDELGMVVALAVMGKAGSADGDTLADPTISLEYDILNWQTSGQPIYSHILAREVSGPSNPGWLENYTYSDGSGAVIMTKTQAAPGMAAQWDQATLQTTQVYADPRWIGTGRTIFNNKGNPVKQYEPYFSTNNGYESEEALVQTGVTPLLYYDPLGRNILTALPDGTLSKITFDSWYSKVYDPNDTVMDSSWYASLGSPAPGGPEPSDPNQRAAWLAAKDYDTPAVLHTDSLGRGFYSVADYGGGITAATYLLCDLSNRYSQSYDQLNRLVAESYTNMLGQAFYSKTAEKGQRWIFQDVMGRLVNLWDNDIYVFSTSFDTLNRPVSTYLTQGASTTVMSHTVYGDLFSMATGVAMNLRGRVYQVYDQSGVMTMENVDFKGNVLVGSKVLCSNYTQMADWSALDGLTDIAAIQAAAQPFLETETFTSTVAVDALNRPIQLTLPDGSILTPEYDAGNNVAAISANIMGAATATNLLVSQAYNARGQRLNAQYGNQTITNYTYDPERFSLTNITTLQNPASPASTALQNLNFYFDPVGNITQVNDSAQQTHFFANAVVAPVNKYVYDALYQLVSATGREHAGLGMDTQRSNADIPVLSPIPEANNATAVRNYTENYSYDVCGNLLSLAHVASGASWTQRYQYQYQVTPTDNTNRLIASSLPGDPPGVFSGAYSYNGGTDLGLHGNMTSMPGQSPGSMSWNYLDQLASVDLGGGGTAYYVYGFGGSRVRKVIERQGGLIQERIYLGPVEIYRERQGTAAPTLERYTLRVEDEAGCFVQADTKTIDTNDKDPDNALGVPNIKYQYGNHLSSALLETDALGNIVSYEEYHPFGTSSYRVTQTGNDISLKRYRYGGKERDEETGFYYYGARYYAAWLGRWTSSDPGGFADGLNLYRFCRNNPVSLNDPSGTEVVSDDVSKVPEKIRNALRTNSDPARQTLDEYYKGKVIQGQTLDPGSFHWDASKGQNWGNFSPVGGARDAGSGQGTGDGKSDVSKDPGPSGSESKGDQSPPAAGTPPAAAAPPNGTAGTATNATEAPPSKPSAQGAEAGATDKNAGTPAGPRPGAPASLAAPGAEKFIWTHYDPKMRGKILEVPYGVPWRSNTKGWDTNLATKVQQVKSTSDYKKIGDTTREANRDASQAIKDNPATMGGKSSQAVIITETDAPASAGADIRTALNPGRGRKIPANSLPPEHVRGLPGRIGMVGKGLTIVGTGLSAFALGYDLYKGDYPMAAGDALSAAGGGLEVYALATAGAVGTVTIGLGVGGLGIAVTSGISMVRAYKAGDTGGVVAGGLGVGAGLAIAAGAAGILLGVAGAPLLLAGGLVVATGVGLYGLYHMFK